MRPLQMGDIIRIPPGADGAEAGIYIIVSDPADPIVEVCLAGEDDEGDIIETVTTCYIPRETLGLVTFPPIRLMPSQR